MQANGILASLSCFHVQTLLFYNCFVKVSDHKKATSSTAGMQTTVETSPLLKYRADVIVPDRMVAMTAAIKDRDFETFADLTMKVQ